MAIQPRPLSPHLQIWRFTLAMTLSITHRITGVGLYLGTALVALWLAAAALGDETFTAVNGFFGHPLIQIALFLYTLTLFQHMAGGIKHLIWDTGAGLDAPARNVLSAGTLIFSVLATCAVWAAFVWL